MSEGSDTNQGAEMPVKIASCCFPLLGAILYFVWKDSKPQAAKDTCTFALVGGVGFICVPAVSLILSFLSLVPV